MESNSVIVHFTIIHCVLCIVDRTMEKLSRTCCRVFLPKPWTIPSYLFTSSSRQNYHFFSVQNDLSPTCRPNSTYELSRNEQFVFNNIAQINTVRLAINLADTDPRACEHSNKFNCILYEKNEFYLSIFKLQTYFKEHYIC
jgi:hypothetical protein